MKIPVINVLLLSLILVCQCATSIQAETQVVAITSSTRDLNRTIKLELVVDAPLERVWWAWTTREGIRSFFAPDCEIDLRVLGKYDILFAPTAPIGLRGAENNLILAIQEGKMFSFTWDAPPQFPNIRKQRTTVIVRFLPIAAGKTRLLFTQSGWGEGEEWDQVHDYFVSAWGEVVLPFLKYSLEVGPIDWKNPPQKLKKATNAAG